MSSVIAQKYDQGILEDLQPLQFSPNFTHPLVHCHGQDAHATIVPQTPVEFVAARR